MKTKAARKAVRPAKPMKKRTRGKKQARATPIPEKKETFQTVAAEPEMIESSADVFEAPVEFVDADQEPVVDVIEVFQVTVADDEDEI